MAIVLGRKPGGSGGGGAPSGPAGGSLDGTYPNPTLGADSVDSAEIASGAVGRSELATGIGAFDLLFDSVLGSAGTFDFTPIPATYKHLKLVWSMRGTQAATSVSAIIRFNNDSGSNYFWQALDTVTTTVAAAGTASDSAISFASVSADSATAGRVGVGEAIIPDYASTVFHKSISATDFHSRGATNTTQATNQRGGVWVNTAAITRITVLPSAGTTFMTGSRLSLYGLG